MSKKSDKKDKKSKKDHKKKKNKKEKEKKKKDQKERIPSDRESSEGEPQTEVSVGMQQLKDEEVSIFDNRGVIAEESTLYNVGVELQRTEIQEDRVTRLTTSLFPIK
jgi:hypothetical protein